VAEVPKRRSAPAFVTSCAFGLLGAIFLLAGVVTGSVALVVVATALGALSLAAALVWRGQLIQQWRAQRDRRSVSPPPPPATR